MASGHQSRRAFPLLLKGQSFRLTASHFSLLVQRKVTKRKHSRDASRCGCVAAVPCAPRGPGGRRTTRYAQTRAPLRPSFHCGARLALRRGKSKAEEQKQPQQQEPKPKHPYPTLPFTPRVKGRGYSRALLQVGATPIPPSPDPRQGAHPPPAASCTP